MCVSILGDFKEELFLTKEEALIGFRNWNTRISGDKLLRAVSFDDFTFPFNIEAVGNPKLKNSQGIYSYNYYNYNYNNYNSNYNYYNYNYNNYNYYNYSIAGKCKLWGRIIEYSKGYRSEFAYPEALVVIDRDSEYFRNEKTKVFANHFNTLIEGIARAYNCRIIEFKNYK